MRYEFWVKFVRFFLRLGRHKCEKEIVIDMSKTYQKGKVVLGCSRQ